MTIDNLKEYILYNRAKVGAVNQTVLVFYLGDSIIS